MIRLQTVLEDDVVVSVYRDAMHYGSMLVPTCKLRIDDETDGEHDAVIATLNADETEALGQALLRIAEQLRERAEKYAKTTSRIQGWEAAMSAPEPEQQEPPADGEDLQSMTRAADATENQDPE